MIDSHRHQGMRKRLVAELEEKGIQDRTVLNAIAKIPRHWFMDNAFVEFAYEDKAFPIAAGQTISQPYTVAFQSELLQVEPGMKVLEIGTGSGYQSSVLCELGCKVFTIERQKKLFDTVQSLLLKMNYRPKFFYGDGYLGKEPFAPFDRIIVTCGAPMVPQDLFEQLKEGGRMVIPVGEDEQEMLLVEKIQGKQKVTKHGMFRFVPMLEDRNK